MIAKSSLKYLVRKPRTKNRVSYNDRVRKGLIADFDRIKPSDQCQVVCRVELWYRSRVMGVFLYTPLKFMEERLRRLTTDND